MAVPALPLLGRSALATHSSTLAWKIPGRRSLVGCHLWGHTESDTTDVTSQQQCDHIFINAGALLGTLAHGGNRHLWSACSDGLLYQHCLCIQTWDMGAPLGCLSCHRWGTILCSVSRKTMGRYKNWFLCP